MIAVLFDNQGVRRLEKEVSDDCRLIEVEGAGGVFFVRTETTVVLAESRRGIAFEWVEPSYIGLLPNRGEQ